MGETADQLRQEVDRKREDAGQKIDAIEQRVSDTATRVQEGVAQTAEQVKATVQESVEGAMSAVGDTTQHVAEQVKQTTQQVTEQVKANFDWQKQIDERPLVMLGAAMLGGFVLGSLTGGDDEHRQRSYRVPDYSSSYGVHHYGHQGSQPQYQQTGQGFQGGLGYQGYERFAGSQGYTGQSFGSRGGSGMMSGVRGVLEDSGLQQTLTSAAAALLGSAGDRIRSTLEKEVPGFADQMKQRTESAPGATGSGGSLAGSEGPATSDATGRTVPYFGGPDEQAAGTKWSSSSTG